MTFIIASGPIQAALFFLTALVVSLLIKAAIAPIEKRAEEKRREELVRETGAESEAHRVLKTLQKRYGETNYEPRNR